MAPKAKAKAKARTKPKMAAKPGSSESTSESEVEEPKLTVPKKEFTGDKPKFENWKRSVQLWRSKYPSQSQKMLGANLMECISGDAEDTIFANLEPGAETYDAVMATLVRAYGDRDLAASTRIVSEYKELKRGKLSLSTFLPMYVTARNRARRYGLTVSPMTDGSDLLNACELSVSQHSNILQQLQVRAELAGEEFARPAWEPTLKALEMLASTFEIHDQQRKIQKRPAALMTAECSEPDVKRPKPDKGKGQSKGKGQPKAPCRNWQTSGTCRFGDKCRYKHERGHAPPRKGDGKGGGGGKGVCHEWTKGGTCSYGDKCRFAHNKATGSSGAPAAYKHA